MRPMMCEFNLHFIGFCKNLVLLLFTHFLFFPNIAHAYIGVALSTGGAVMIGLLVLSILLALYVLVWLPIRQRFKLTRRKVSDSN